MENGQDELADEHFVAVSVLSEFLCDMSFSPLQGLEHGQDDVPNGEVPTLLGAEAALRVVAERLPRIIPNVLINKREGIEKASIAL